MQTFTIPLNNAQLPSMPAGELEINYSDTLESVYWRHTDASKWIVMPLMMLQSEMFAPVLLKINNAIENNKQ